MRVTLSHTTAAYHWLMTPMDGRDLERPERRSTLGTCPTKVRELAYFDLEDYEVEGVRTELLVTDAAARPGRDRFRYRTCCRDFPAGSFVSLDAGIQIVSPELSFWQMGGILPLGELIKFGDLLGGKCSYTLGDDGRMLGRRVPLTTVDRLADFASKMGSVRNNRNVFRALKYLVDGVESPREAEVATLLCLKRQYGGFGLPKPEMGHVVELDEAGRKLADSDTCRCDMYWADANYDLEYDSDQNHGGDKATHDSMRRSAIRHMGIKVGELRWAQLKDPELFEISARAVADDIGYRLRQRSQQLEFKYHEAYLDLRKQLFWQERMDDPSPLRIGELGW